MKNSALAFLLLWTGAVFAKKGNRPAAKPPALRKDKRQASVCAQPYDDIQLGPFVKPSWLTACFRELEVDSDLMVQHITALREIFQDYFCFYDIANDAADSNPLSFQPELGYTLFTGEEEGQMNLDQELIALNETVASEGASIGTFYDIQTIFNKLRDAHVYPFPVAGTAGELMYSLIVVIPEHTQDGTTLASWDPSYDESGELEIKVVLVEEDGTEIEDMVTSIDGKTPFEWYYSLISNPAISYPYQSIGARLNAAFQSIQPLAGFAFSFEGTGLPPDVLGDSFPVTYASGKEENYLVGAELYSQSTQQTYNSTLIYDFVNSEPVFDEPGPAFLNFALALFRIINATSTDVKQMMEPKPKKVMSNPKPKSGHTAGKDEYEWDELITVKGVPGFDFVETKVVGGFKITDEYAVLKLNSFLFFEGVNGGSAVIDFWSNFTAAAKARGVKKAMIDISQNGGGSIDECLAFAISMYPFARYEILEENFDITYNEPMSVFNSSVAPILDVLAEAMTNVTDTELQEYLEANLTDTIGEQLAAVGDALLSFCCEAPNLTECANERCEIFYNQVVVPIGTMNEFPSGPQLRTVLEGLLASLLEFNPFKTLSFTNVDPTQIYEVVRGGVAMNLTNKFAAIEETFYNEVVVNAFHNDWMFDEYTLVGDGTGGSATMLFSGTLMQLWNNRDTMWNGRGVPPARLTTVTFGGSNEPQGTTIAGFPASVQAGAVGIPIMASGILSMLQALFPNILGDVIGFVNEAYTSTLAAPPYFAGTLPSMPVYNFYSRFMDPGAMPMQYVKMFGELHHHIPQIYTSISLADSSDLETLYSQAAKLGFSASGGKPPPIEDSKDEAFHNFSPDSFDSFEGDFNNP